jgi:hypothetical protein
MATNLPVAKGKLVTIFYKDFRQDNFSNVQSVVMGSPTSDFIEVIASDGTIIFINSFQFDKFTIS